MTQTYENIEKAMVNIKEAAEKNPMIQGIHLEGPFISVNYKGAQDASDIKKPDENVLAKWNALSGNVTVSSHMLRKKQTRLLRTGVCPIGSC